MEHITRHIILGVLEGSPDFDYARQPAKIMVQIKDSSITKERDLVREGRASIDCSKLAEVVRELHRQFLRHADTEITEFADETERDIMEIYQPITYVEYDAIRLQHSQATTKSDQGSTTGSAATRLSAAPFKPVAPPRKAPLLAPGCNSQKAPWLSANDQRRLKKGLKPRGQMKRNVEERDVPEAKRRRHGPLEAKVMMGDLPIRGKKGGSI